jgi:Protein of unknown function (DUF1236)
MKRFLPAVVGLVFLGSAGVALAQGHGRHGGPGGGGAPGGGGGVRGSGGGAMRSPGGGAMHAPRGGGAQMHAPRSYQAPRAYHERSRRAERPQQRSQRLRHAEPRRLDQNRQLHQSRQLRAQRQLRQTREAERNRALSTGQKAVAGQQGRQASERGLEQRVAARHNEIQQARSKLGTQDRERLHRAFNYDRARLTRVNFDHHVGRRIPRHVRLVAIPAAVFAFFPYYRDYSYFVVEDEICIVDPRTYVIVDVIDQGYWGGGPQQQVAGLQLSEREIALIRDSVPPDFPDAGLQLRLALGAEIPDNVQLHQFAPLLLDQVAQLREYRFLISGDQIVIVQPNDRSIALVIDRR